MTTLIKFPGKYELFGDSYQNLDIRASNVIFNGNNYTLYGWIHIGNDFHRTNNVKIINLNIQPPINIYNHTDAMCPICEAIIFNEKDTSIVNSESLIYAHGNKYQIESCNLIPNKELDSHITISHTQNSNINGIDINNDNGKTIYYLKFEE